MADNVSGTSASGPAKKITAMRIVVAVVVGFVGAVLIWVITPFNNFTLYNGYISDSYLPVTALVIIVVIMLIVNPLIGLIFKRERMLSKQQLAIIFGILLVACALPGDGLLRVLPYSLSKTTVDLNTSKEYSSAFEKIKVPQMLFPGSTAFGANNPQAEKMFTGYLKEDKLPWGAWLKPLAGWGIFIVFCWLMMGSLASIVLPQWRDNEKLPFPLVEVAQSYIEEPEEGLLPALYKSRWFWIAFIAITLLHSLNMLAQYFPDRFPSIPLALDITGVFTQPPLIYLPGSFFKTPIYFIFIAMGFFMPFRMGFSIWFFSLAYGFYSALGRTYVPNFSALTVNDHRTGAMIVLTVYVLWLGREHWINVVKSMFFRLKGDAAFRDALSGWLFVIGCIGMLGWMFWFGVGVWALFYLFMGFMISILIMRFLAETGTPFIKVEPAARMGMDVLPMSWMSAVPVYFNAFFAIFTMYGSRSCFPAFALHALGMPKDMSEKSRTKLLITLIVIALSGVVICGAVHLVSAYRYTPFMGGSDSLTWGKGVLDNAQRDLISFEKGTYAKNVTHNRPLHLVAGAVLTGVLQWLCVTFPAWPLHPIGIILALTFFGNMSWLSILIGWAVKGFIVRFGGSKLLRTAKPFFLGLIAGEAVIIIVWASVAAVLAFSGLPYEKVLLQPY